MSDNKVIVEVDLETGDIKKVTGDIEKELTKSGAKAGSGFADSFMGSVSKIAAGFTIATVLEKTFSKLTDIVSDVFSKGIEGAAAQEDAVNQLNSALLMSTNASVSASKGIQDYASALQQTTKFGDDTIVSTAALIQQLGDLDKEGLKRATKAALDLSSGLSIDLNSAAMLVGKAATGNVSAFARYGMAMKDTGDNAKDFANALAMIESKVGGASERSVNTFSGAITQLDTAFGDVLEEIANLLIKSPQVITLIKDITKAFGTLAGMIADFGAKVDVFAVLSIALVDFNDAFIKYIIAPFEMLFNLSSIVANAVFLGFNMIVAGIGNVGWAIAKVLDALNIGGQISEDLKVFEQTSEEVALESAYKLNSALGKIGDFSISDKLATKNDELRTYFEEQNQIAADQRALQTEVQDQQKEKAMESLMTWSQVYKNFYDQMNQTTAVTQENIKKTNETMKNFVADSTKQLRDGFAKGAGQAFSAFGAALAKGENALDAFTKVLFKTIADQAIALGTSFMLQGAAMLFSPNPADNARAPFLIQAGAALAAFGGFIGATSGGGGTGGSTAGNTGVGAGNVDLTNDVASPENQERAAPNTNVSVVVEGSLVRQDELGEFITKTLNESFSKQGVTLTGARATA